MGCRHEGSGSHGQEDARGGWGRRIARSSPFDPRGAHRPRGLTPRVSPTPLADGRPADRPTIGSPAWPRARSRTTEEQPKNNRRALQQPSDRTVGALTARSFGVRAGLRPAPGRCAQLAPDERPRPVRDLRLGAAGGHAADELRPARVLAGRLGEHRLRRLEHPAHRHPDRPPHEDLAVARRQPRGLFAGASRALDVAGPAERLRAIERVEPEVQPDEPFELVERRAGDRRPGCRTGGSRRARRACRTPRARPTGGRGCRRLPAPPPGARRGAGRRTRRPAPATPRASPARPTAAPSCSPGSRRRRRSRGPPRRRTIRRSTRRLRRPRRRCRPGGPPGPDLVSRSAASDVGRTASAPEQGQPVRAVGDLRERLGRDRPDAGLDPRAGRADERPGRLDGDPEAAARRIASDDRVGHGRSLPAVPDGPPSRAVRGRSDLPAPRSAAALRPSAEAVVRHRS